MLCYRGYTLSWQGRQLSILSGNGVTASYKYDATGLRSQKTVGGVITKYQYVGDKLLYENRGGMAIYYKYNSMGNLSGITYYINGTAYAYYVLCNSRGDVDAIYNGAGTLAAKYTYDTWGNVLSITDANGNPISSSSTHVGNVNPIRYRGYYYDGETGLYLTATRYYDPVVGRFINADGVVADVGGDIRGYNLFAYCMNNPVNMSDPFGQWPQWIKNAVNWVKNTFNIKTSSGSVTTTNSSVVAKGPNISESIKVGPFSNKASGSLGYAEGMFRGQLNQKGNNASNTLIGGFGKASAINYGFQNRLGTENIGISQKNVLDIGVVTAQAGIQYKQGPGVAVGARASVAAARGTYCIDVFGWQLEVGMDANVLSAGVEFAYGALPEGGWGSKGGAGAGLFGFGYVIRLTPN